MGWIIYKHTNIVNNKVYIGQTKQTLKNRWRNGNGYRLDTRFGQAINKYGWDNFTHEVLENNINSQEAANERECYWISHYNSYDYDHGYNMSPGGCLISEESKNKARKTYQENFRNKPDFLYCVELNKFFYNPTNALDWFLKNGYKVTGRKNPIVTVLDKENRTHFGYHFCSIRNLFTYKPLFKEQSNKRKGHTRKVICIDTGDVFDSLTICAKTLNLRTQNLSRACKQHSKTHGMYFAYMEEYETSWQKYKKEKKNYLCKSIYCIELDRSWDSYQKCSKELGFSSSRLSLLIGQQDPLHISNEICGYHFCKLDEVDFYRIEPKKSIRIDSRRVVCCETGQIFSSISEAEKAIGKKNILKCCKDWKYTSGSYHWCFENELEFFKPGKQIERARRNKLAKKVRRIEDGLIFISASKAAKTVNRDVTTLLESIKKKTKCGGYHWEILEKENE